jgi:hypothetical protein
MDYRPTAICHSSEDRLLHYVETSRTLIHEDKLHAATIDTPHSLITGPPSIVKFDNEGITYIGVLPTRSGSREMIHWVLQSTILKKQNQNV